MRGSCARSCSAPFVLGAIWEQRRRELSWMAFVAVFLFMMWMYQVRLLTALFLLGIAAVLKRPVLQWILIATGGAALNNGTTTGITPDDTALMAYMSLASANIIDASFEALLDAIHWKLIRDVGAPVA